MTQSYLITGWCQKWVQIGWWKLGRKTINKWETIQSSDELWVNQFGFLQNNLHNDLPCIRLGMTCCCQYPCEVVVKGPTFRYFSVVILSSVIPALWQHHPGSFVFYFLEFFMALVVLYPSGIYCQWLVQTTASSCSSCFTATVPPHWPLCLSNGNDRHHCCHHLKTVDSSLSFHPS